MHFYLALDSWWDTVGSHGLIDRAVDSLDAINEAILEEQKIYIVLIWKEYLLWLMIFMKIGYFLFQPKFSNPYEIISFAYAFKSWNCRLRVQKRIQRLRQRILSYATYLDSFIASSDTAELKFVQRPDGGPRDSLEKNREPGNDSNKQRLILGNRLPRRIRTAWNARTVNGAAWLEKKTCRHWAGLSRPT